MKTKRIAAVLLALAMVFTLSISAFAAAPADSTQTVTFNAYATEDPAFADFPVSVSITNATKQETKDFSLYLSDDKITISGKNSKVIYCNAPVTVTLQPLDGEKHSGFNNFALFYDSNKVPIKSVQVKDAYYAFDTKKYAFDYSKKLTSQPAGDWGYAEGSSQMLTKAGTYVLNVQPMNAIDDSEVALTPVFIVVGGASTTSVTAVSLNKTTVSLAKGATVQLTATVKPTNATNKAVTWASSNVKIATVDAKGKVTGKAKGTATITCKAADGSSKTATCKVTVK